MKKTDTRAITAALALSTASTGPQIVALSLLMPDISQALNTPIPILGQLNTTFSVIAIIISLIMGALTVKYPAKNLLQIGTLSLLIGVIGAALSPNYTTMFIFFILFGVGNGLVLPIINLLVTLYPPAQRTAAMGRIFSGRSLTSILATPVIGFLAARYGWRTGYIGFGAPLIIICIIMVYIAIPKQQQKQEQTDLTAGFRNILANKSATACLIAASLALVFFASLMVYNGTYMRTILGFSLEHASLIMSLIFIAVAIGQIASGAIADRLGSKTSATLSTLIAGTALLAYFSLNLPAPLAILASAIGTAAAGTTMTTVTTYNLKQAPESRGTMMSLNSAAISIGSMLASAIGGIAITSLGWTGYGAVMFTISLTSAIIFHKWTHDPETT